MVDDKILEEFGTLSPSKNPFTSPTTHSPKAEDACDEEIGKMFAEIKFTDSNFLVPNASGNERLPVLVNNLSPRESLGILPDSVFKEQFPNPFFLLNDQPINENPNESLEILDVDALALGRESLGLFNYVTVTNDGQLNHFSTDPGIMSMINEDHTSTRSSLNKAFIQSGRHSQYNISSASSAVLSTENSIPMFNRTISISRNELTSSNLVKSLNVNCPVSNGTSSQLRNGIQSLPELPERDSDFTDVKQELENSVFTHSENWQNNSEDKSFDNERYLLDATPQPNWDEFDLSKSSIEPEKLSPLKQKACIEKQIEKMMGMQPVRFKEKLPSEINNEELKMPLELQRNAEVGKELIIRKIEEIDEVIDRNTEFSRSQKEESHRLLFGLITLLQPDSDKATTNIDDSGHSSVVGPVLEDKSKENISAAKRGPIKQKSDKSQKGTSAVKAISSATSTSGNNTKSVFQKGPLKAVLPVENMAKHIKILARTSKTPENPRESNVSIPRNRLSTPFQEGKLKPMAASTPEEASKKQNHTSLLTPKRSKYSFSGMGNKRLTDSNASKPSVKPEIRDAIPKFSRSKSFDTYKESNVKDATRKSTATCKTTNIFSAISKMRENILSSPHYQRSLSDNGATVAKRSNMITPTKIAQLQKGKENVKP